ncbi:MAG: tripartite tricarboxylate transporter substrate binding protein [Acetobacteraceae bacterium]|nr:tripartite tricarboxylate transporter substrate binding protein [Acetobacteraceae bacterium]
MSLSRRLLLAGSAATLAGPALAQGRSIRLIVAFPPGGAVDILGRTLAERLSPVLGQTVVVENRGGAGGVIGANAIARGEHDGSVIGLIGATALCAVPFMTTRLPFDPRRDLAPVSLITDGALLCVVNAETARRHGWTGFRALIRWSRANPERVRMGSSGAGTSSHINIEAINHFAEARILHVPYRGGGPAINDLVAGNIDMMFDVMPALMPHVEAGRFLAFAVSSGPRLAVLPQVPGMADFADLGLGQHSAATWNAVMAPGGTPEPVIARLHRAVRTVGADPEVIERLRPLGYGAVTSETPAHLARLIARDTPVWQRLVEISGARLE